jgi:hypothetical protein
MTIHCGIIRKLYPLAPACCTSCHEDAEEFGIPLAGDGGWMLCCGVQLFVQAIGYNTFHDVPVELMERAGKLLDKEG